MSRKKWQHTEETKVKMKERWAARKAAAPVQYPTECHGKCKRLLPESSFTFANKKTGLRRKDCKDCNNDRKKEWQKQNGKEAYQRYKTGSTSWKWQRIKEIRDVVTKLKKKPCTDCGHSYDPWIMEYDHLPKYKKLGNVATMIRAAKPLATILAEIAKCELVCSNCHRDRTYRRQVNHWYGPPRALRQVITEGNM